MFTMAADNLTAADRQNIVQQINDEDFRKLIPTISVFGVLACVGTVGNSISILVFAARMKRTFQNDLFVLLSVVNFVACAVCLPFEIVAMSYMYVYPSLALCKISRFIDVFSVALSVVTLSVQAILRLKAASTGTSINPSRTKSFMMILALIVSSCGLSCLAPVVYGFRACPTFIYDVKGRDCSYGDDVKESAWPTVLTIMYVTGFITLIVITVFTYYKIWRIVKRSRSAIAAHNMATKPPPTDRDNTVCKDHVQSSDVLVNSPPAEDIMDSSDIVLETDERQSTHKKAENVFPEARNFSPSGTDLGGSDQTKTRGCNIVTLSIEKDLITSNGSTPRCQENGLGTTTAAAVPAQSPITYPASHTYQPGPTHESREQPVSTAASSVQTAFNEASNQTPKLLSMDLGSPTIGVACPRSGKSLYPVYESKREVSNGNNYMAAASHASSSTLSATEAKLDRSSDTCRKINNTREIRSNDCEADLLSKCSTVYLTINGKTDGELAPVDSTDNSIMCSSSTELEPIEDIIIHESSVIIFELDKKACTDLSVDISKKNGCISKVENVDVSSLTSKTNIDISGQVVSQAQQNGEPITAQYVCTEGSRRDENYAENVRSSIDDEQEVFKIANNVNVLSRASNMDDQNPSSRAQTITSVPQNGTTISNTLAKAIMKRAKLSSENSIKSKSMKSLKIQKSTLEIAITRTAFLLTFTFIVSYVPFFMVAIPRMINEDIDYSRDVVLLNLINTGTRLYFITPTFSPVIFWLSNLDFRKNCKALMSRRSIKSVA